MQERRFNRDISVLRDPERIARLEVQRVVELSLENLNSPKTVLDVGTGSGIFAGQFVDKGLEATGVDANPEMLRSAQEYVHMGTFKEGIAEALPFKDGSFDLVFMGLLLHETDNPPAALREAHRVAVLRLVVLEWPDAEQPFGPPREHRLSEEKITHLAHAAGFDKIETVRLQHLVLYRMDR